MKANRKVSAFARVANYVDFQKAKLVYQSFCCVNFQVLPLDLGVLWKNSD